ncbi:hypothetical protein [Rhizobium leguminosarum]|uniref:hypothetical protein n=1 Tax=Rhizobium leguminosarum TaxID=384 RepID=UPI002FF3A271
MRRVRWFGLQSKLPVDALAARLKQRAYNTEQGDGFVLEQLRPTYLVARFVERVHRVDEVLDPFGNPETFERFEYRSQQFRVSNYGPGLEFTDPARNARTLVSRLLELTDFDLVIAPVSIDPWIWASDIQSALGATGIIDRVQAKNVQIGAEALASVQIDARTDALSAFRSFVRVPDITLEKVRIRLPGKTGMFAVSASGGLEATGREHMMVIDAARSSLAQAGARS